MFKQLTLAGAALAMTAGMVVPVAPASAQDYRGGYDQRGYVQRDNGYRGGGYNNDRGGYRNYDRTYRNNDRSYRNRGDKCRDGDGGTIVGAIAGGLAGNVVAGRGDKTLGTIIGGALGALAGRTIDRSDRPGYCRR